LSISALRDGKLNKILKQDSHFFLEDGEEYVNFWVSEKQNMCEIEQQAVNDCMKRIFKTLN